MTGISRRAVSVALLAGPVAARAQAPAAAPWKLPSNAEIEALLAARLDQQRQGVGIVVGVIDASGRRVVSRGVRAKGDTRPLDGDTVFEIGSMTKVFTSLVLADMVRKGEVKLDDPVQKYLPATVHIPERGGRQITLADLATHTSALPRMPNNFRPKDPKNPYVDYSEDQLWAFLNGLTLTRDIGGEFEYSNLAVGLLGEALCCRARVDYETLVRSRILQPLGMTDTAVRLNPSMRARLAPGHTQGFEPTSNWDLGPAFAGAGALRSTANDLLTFLAAELGFPETPLKAAMADQYTVVRRPTGGPQQIALGWMVMSFKTGEVITHGGGTGGYRTYFGFDPKLRIGAVVLTNAATVGGGDDIALHLLAGRPMQVLDPPPQEIAVSPDQLAPYVGVYEAGPGVRLTVTQHGAELSAQIGGQSADRIYPSAVDEFFWKVVDAQVSFRMGPDGKATIAEMHQNRRTVLWRRITP